MTLSVAFLGLCPLPPRPSSAPPKTNPLSEWSTERLEPVYWIRDVQRQWDRHCTSPIGVEFPEGVQTTLLVHPIVDYFTKLKMFPDRFIFQHHNRDCRLRSRNLQGPQFGLLFLWKSYWLFSQRESSRGPSRGLPLYFTLRHPPSLTRPV